MVVNNRLEVLRKRKRWAQKEAEIRNLVKEQERRKADSDSKAKAKSSNSKVEQVSQNNTTLHYTTIHHTTE